MWLKDYTINERYARSLSDVSDILLKRAATTTSPFAATENVAVPEDVERSVAIKIFVFVFGLYPSGSVAIVLLPQALIVPNSETEFCFLPYLYGAGDSPTNVLIPQYP